MGIFSTNYEGSVLAGLDMNADIKPALESANFTAMGLEVCAEAEANYNMIMKAVGVAELNYFEENGQEIVYEAGGAGFLETVKKFFINLWNKVKEIFHKFFAYINMLTKSHKDFAKKYEKEARDKWSKIKDEFSIKGYKFKIPDSINYKSADEAVNDCFSAAGLPNALKVNGNDSTAKIAALGTISNDTLKTAYDEITTFNKNMKDKKSDYIEAMRGKIVKGLFSNNPGNLTAEEFAKELFEGFRDGDSEKQTLEKEDLDFETSLSELKSYEKTKRGAENDFKEVKKLFDSTIKSIESLQKDLTNKTGSERATKTDNGKTIDATSALLSTVNTMLDYVKSSREAVVTVNGAYLQALKDRANQDKHFIAALVTTSKVQKESAEEYGASVSENAASMDFLSNINFV